MTHSLERQNEKDWKWQVWGKMWNNWDSHILLVSVLNGKKTLENGLSVFITLNISLSGIDLPVPVPSIDPKEMKIYTYLH